MADLRAPTPSAAAELVIESQHQLEQRVETFRQRLTRAARYQLLMARQTLTQLAQHGAFARMSDLIGRRQQRLDELVFRLASAERRRLQEYRTRLDTASARVRARDLRRTLDVMRRDFEARSSTVRTACARRSTPSFR